MDEAMSHHSAISLEPVSDRRATARFTMLIRTGKLITAEGEYLCIVSNISTTGVKIRTFYPLPTDPEMMLELSNGDRYSIRKVWESEGKAGFSFTDNVNIAALLRGGPDNLRKRSVRLKFALPATLHAQGVHQPVLFRDISQQGACIECPKRLAIDEQVRIDSPLLPPIVAKVRWRREPQYGLIFEHTFRFDQLARLTAPLRQRK